MNVHEPSPNDAVLEFFSPKKTVAGQLSRLTNQAFCRHTITIRTIGSAGVVVPAFHNSGSNSRVRSTSLAVQVD